MRAYSKGPGEVFDLPFDWSDRLDAGETVTAQAAYVDGQQAPPGEALQLDQVLGDGSTVAVWVSGGTAGVDYRLTCEATTDAGRTWWHTVIVHVRDERAAAA